MVTRVTRVARSDRRQVARVQHWSHHLLTTAQLHTVLSVTRSDHSIVLHQSQQTIIDSPASSGSVVTTVLATVTEAVSLLTVTRVHHSTPLLSLVQWFAVVT